MIEVRTYFPEQIRFFESMQSFVTKKQFVNYLVNVEKSASQIGKGVDADTVTAPFYEIEKAISLYKNKQLKPFYERIFFHLKRNVFFPALNRGELSVGCFLIASVILKSGIKPAGALSNYLNVRIKIVDRIEKLSNSAVKEKFILTMNLYLLDIFEGAFENGTADFVKGISKFDYSTVSKSFGTDRFEKNIKIILDSVFCEDLEKGVNLFNENVFDEDHFFRTNSFADQKRKFFWGGWLLWRIYGTEKPFLNYYESWKKIFERAVKEGSDDLVFHAHNILTHVYGNITHTQSEWAKLNGEVHKPFGDYVAESLAKNRSLKAVDRKPDSRKRLKIGFTLERLVKNAPFKVFFSLLKSLAENSSDKYRFVVYDLGFVEKSESLPELVDDVKKLGVEYVSCHSLIDDAALGMDYSKVDKCVRMREKILSDNIDILIGGCHNFLDIFLYATRTAPLQIYWSHGSYDFDVRGIDQRIIHSDSDKEIDAEGFVFNGFVLPFDINEWVPHREKTKIEEIRKRFPKGSVILGSIGRMIKLDSEEYLEAVAEIMKKNRNTVYLACGEGGTENIRRKVAELGIGERFFFEGHVDAHLYGYVMDLLLDPFPLGNGTAKWEFALKENGKCFVMKETPSSDISYLHSMVSQFENAGFESDEIPVVFDIREYISVSDRMIKDIEIRKRAGAVYLKSHLDSVSEKEDSDFLSVLMKIVKKYGMVLS